MAKFIILTEAGGEIGFGHLTRCTALVEELIARNQEASLICHFHSQIPTVENYIIDQNWMQNIDKLCESFKDTTVLVDSYLATVDVYHKIVASALRLVAIDDYNRISYPTSFVVNPNVAGEGMDYQKDYKNFITGAGAVILRAEIRAERKIKNIPETPSTLMIFVGGSDHNKVLNKLLDGLAWEEEMLILAGNEAYKMQLEKEYPASRISFYGHLNAGEMREVMERADIAITTCGQSVGELAYLGVPCIGIIDGDDQILNARAYLEHHFIPEEIYSDDEMLIPKMNSYIEKYKTLTVRRSLSIMGQNLIDGKGVNNIIDKIIA